MYKLAVSVNKELKRGLEANKTTYRLLTGRWSIWRFVLSLDHHPLSLPWTRPWGLERAMPWGHWTKPWHWLRSSVGHWPWGWSWDRSFCHSLCHIHCTDGKVAKAGLKAKHPPTGTTTCNNVDHQITTKERWRSVFSPHTRFNTHLTSDTPSMTDVNNL